MLWLFSFLLLALLGAVQALSSIGGRLLVVLEDSAEKDKYSQFLGDLECMRLPIQHHNQYGVENVPNDC